MLWNEALGLFAMMITWFATTPREVKNQELPRRELLWVFCGVIGFFAVMFLIRLLVPKSVDLALERYKPAMIAVAWGLGIWFSFSSWRKSVAQQA
jgi:hypothetical protein